jgi:hypothetical protein
LSGRHCAKRPGTGYRKRLFRPVQSAENWPQWTARGVWSRRRKSTCEGSTCPTGTPTGFAIRGSALNWQVDGTTPPDRFELAVDGLRLVVKTGNPQMDWHFAAQARPNTIDAEMALAWDGVSKRFSVEALKIDFPDDNRVKFSASAKGVDRSSFGALQMSDISFAVTEADLRIRTHGLFEWNVLMALGPTFLPQEGNMEAAAAGLRAETTAAVAKLPDADFPAASKAALSALIAELPNPSGGLIVGLRSVAGIGPARAMGYAVTGVPATVAEIRPVFEGVTITIEWTHEDAP